MSGPGASEHDEPRRSAAVEEAVDELLDRVGPAVRLGLPLGLGKPIQLVNELYGRVAEDPQLSLEIYTALSLAPPAPAGSELERRLAEPIAERVFGGRPTLRYVLDRRRGELPDNVRVFEFYLTPGTLLGNADAQRDYVASNYTHVVRDVAARGLNALAQLVAPSADGSEAHVDLSCNTDLFRDTVDRLEARRTAGSPVFVTGQVNHRLPAMGGDAKVERTAFDRVVDDRSLDFEPYGPPNEPVGDADALVGLYTSALVRDGGTLQIGIGTMSDSVSHMLALRHRDNGGYRRLLEAAAPDATTAETLSRVGGTDPFRRGLFACSEMLVEGFLELLEAGVLTREVYPHAGLQRAVDARDGDTTVDRQLLETLLGDAAVPPRLEADDVAELRAVGLLAADVELEDGHLHRPGHEPVPAELDDPARVAAVARGFLGDRLAGGHVAHAGFFLGPQDFYRRLRELGESDRRRLRMTRVDRVNRLGEEAGLKLAQRRHARFLNETMMVTGLGAAVSDGLDSGRVVSGVGGQYNFVAMAHELPEGRAVLMLNSTRRHDGRRESNIRWSYGHTTIPRHLKDLVVTEYGVADLRGRTDEEVCAALVGVMDARFQEDFVAAARSAGKLGAGYRIPDRHRTNTPARVRDAVAAARRDGRCPRFPLGSDLSDEEADLVTALQALDDAVSRRRLPRPGELRTMLSPPEAWRPHLERMGVDRPGGLTERALRAAVVYGLLLTKPG